MRVLLMVLVLVNLGVFAWLHSYSEDAGRQRQGEPAGDLGRGLLLVGEAEMPHRQEEPEPSPAERRPLADGAPVAMTPARCSTVGPFEQRDAAEIAMERLDDLGIGAVLRESGGQIRAGYWVHLPPFPSRNAARQVEDQLRERGVQDLFIVTAPDQRNAISLGLFTTSERADQRAAEIGRLGFTPRVAERFRDATVYWLDFAESTGESLEPERIGVMGAGDTLPEKLEISCDDIAVAASGA